MRREDSPENKFTRGQSPPYVAFDQRLRELGLLRALGGSTRQIRVLMVIEALVVGVVASVVGIGVGALLALGIKALIAALGGGLPGTFVLTAAPIIWGPSTTGSSRPCEAGS